MKKIKLILGIAVVGSCLLFVSGCNKNEEDIVEDIYNEIDFESEKETNVHYNIISLYSKYSDFENVYFPKDNINNPYLIDFSFQNLK